jgi:hypothetical protein
MIFPIVDKQELNNLLEDPKENTLVVAIMWLAQVIAAGSCMSKTASDKYSGEI